ncbi:MAG: trimethylamine methyltransferase family protein [Methanobacteriota archaeon]|nr:MAG: trimethylamine methyltransferase family protein [Euryarchaeota archaeon]
MKGIPCKQMIKILTDEQVEKVHEASLKILEGTGVRFDSADARRRLMDSGGIAHTDRKDVITFPRSVIEEAIGKVPREVSYFARDPEWDIRYDGEHTYPYAGGGDPNVLDIDTGKARPSTFADVEDAARLGDALENNNSVSHMVIANDVPPWMIELRTMEAGMKNSAKALSHHATRAETVDYMVKIWSCVAGGEEEFRKRPLLSLGSSPSSPLTYASHVCDVLIRSVELGVPFSVIPCPVSGGTGPATLGGSLALQNAETLAGLVLMHAAAPPLPTVYCGRVCFMDPRSGRDLWGVPEEGLVSAALVQLGKRYDMVCDACGTASDVTRWDLQIGFECMMTTLLPVMAGAESVSGIGGGWEGASSLEMMVVGNEVYDDVARVMRGIALDDDVLGLDVIDGVGHMGTYLTQPHTAKYLRKGELRISSLWDKRTSESASREGSKPLIETARDVAKSVLKEHEPMPLDRDVEQEIGTILKDAQKALAR